MTSRTLIIAAGLIVGLSASAFAQGTPGTTGGASGSAAGAAGASAPSGANGNASTPAPAGGGRATGSTQSGTYGRRFLVTRLNCASHRQGEAQCWLHRGGLGRAFRRISQHSSPDLNAMSRHPT